MRIPLFAAIVAGATLTQVGASPIRVIIASGGQDLPDALSHLRFGHALADKPVARISLSQPSRPDLFQAAPFGRRPCAIKEKAIGISNAFRKALGLPLIESATPRPGHNVHGGMVHILPFVGTPPMILESSNYKAKALGSLHATKMQEGQIHRHPYHYHAHPHKYYHRGNNFWMRIHNALMALGPWEGRAVAFVLGCGIGVLLRMFWVLTVVTCRSFRGERDDEYTQVAIIEEYVDAEQIVVPPPSYTIIDEKEPVKVKDGAEN